MEVAKGKEAGLGKAQPEDKGKGKEAKTLPKTQGPEATPKAKETTPKAADPHVSQPASKEDPPPTKAQLRIFLFSLLFVLTFLFLLWPFAIIHDVSFFFLMKIYQLFSL